MFGTKGCFFFAFRLFTLIIFQVLWKCIGVLLLISYKSMYTTFLHTPRKTITVIIFFPNGEIHVQSRQAKHLSNFR